MLELVTPTPIINPDLDEANPIPPVGPHHHISPCHELAVACRRTSLSSDTMASRRVPLEITYRKPGIKPPVALAGTFSEDPWQAEDMESSVDQRGEYTFTKQIWAEEGAQVQYKFRIGSQGLWTLDEDAETVEDESGNTNNIARAGTGAPAGQPLNLPHVSQLQAQDRGGSSTPIRQVAETAAEVADTAEDLDCESEPDDHGPMLAHEDLCICDEQTAPNKQDIEISHPGGGPCSGAHKYDKEPKVDPNDPTIEHFPHDRAGVFATIRRLSTSVDSDDLTFENMSHHSPSSSCLPISESQFKKSASGFAPEEGSSIRQDGEQIGHFTRPRSASLSANSVGAASMSSLGAIAEDDEMADAQEDRNGPLMDGMAPVIQHPGPASGRSNQLDLADVDEGIAMGSAVAAQKQSPGEPREKTPELLTPKSAGSINAIVDKHDPPPNLNPPVNEDAVVTPCDGEHHTEEAPDFSAAKKITSSSPLQNQSPRIIVHDADESDYFFSPKTSHRGASYGATSETSSIRGSRPASTVERPGTSTSMRSIQETGVKNGHEGWLRAFFRVVFVDWIGGILAKLFRWRKAS